jgi:NodT family efflux transporter outer membrane factor (OMF) lipoprotein
LPVPDQYSLGPAQGQSIAHLDWQHFFPDPMLRSLIAEALANNRDIRVASARVAQARASWRIEGAPLYPQLDAVATGTRARSLYTLPGTGNQLLDVKQVTAQLSASWEIDFWGRIRNLTEAARQQFLATEEARRAVATDLVAQVANGYLLEREYEERLELAQRSVATREETLRIMRRRYEVGSGSKFDMEQSQVLLSQAETTLQALVQNQAVNRDALSLLVGKQVDIPSREPGLTRVRPDYPLPAGLPSELLANRPDIVAAEHRLRAANANIGAARAAFFPSISLTGAYGTSSTELSGLFAAGTGTWAFSPTITLPLFNAGRLKGNLDVAKAQRDQAVAEYEGAIQSAFRDVSDALVQRQQLALQVASTRVLLDAQRERARLAQLRFDNGRSNYLEVLDAQRDLFDAEQALVQVRRAELGTIVSLYAALGGGFATNADIDTGTRPQDGGQAP